MSIISSGDSLAYYSAESSTSQSYYTQFSSVLSEGDESHVASPIQPLPLQNQSPAPNVSNLTDSGDRPVLNPDSHLGRLFYSYYGTYDLHQIENMPDVSSSSWSEHDEPRRYNKRQRDSATTYSELIYDRLPRVHISKNVKTEENSNFWLSSEQIQTLKNELLGSIATSLLFESPDIKNREELKRLLLENAYSGTTIRVDELENKPFTIPEFELLEAAFTEFDINNISFFHDFFPEDLLQEEEFASGPTPGEFVLGTILSEHGIPLKDVVFKDSLENVSHKIEQIAYKQK